MSRMGILKIIFELTRYEGTENWIKSHEGNLKNKIYVQNH
jgi:hypothetical protein